MEELNHELDEHAEESQLLDYKLYWDSFFGDEVNGEWHKHAWIKFAEDHTSYALPLLSNFCKMLEN